MSRAPEQLSMWSVEATPEPAGPAGALALAPGSPLRWDSDYDDNDNTVLEAGGGSTDGESNDLYYRLRQEVRNNMHMWVEASSPELMMDEEGPLRWHKQHEAKRAIQRWHDGMVRSYAESVANSVSGTNGK